MKRFPLLFVFVLFLSSCSTIDLAVNFAKKFGGSNGDARYKVGSAYEVRGVWYYPERDLSYDKTGIASWYGDAFAGKKTANGEIFNPSIVSAAHKTLPMPSAVRVTNLENGRAMVIRVNDRGPFVVGRIIDLSREAARLLGFKDNGIAKVRVQILAEESLRLEREANEGRFPSIGTSAGRTTPNTSSGGKVPKVSLTTTKSTGDSTPNTNDDSGAISALDQIASSRSTEVVNVGAVDTSIWIQIGAFAQKNNAITLAAKLETISDTKISTYDTSGLVLYRVRMGPVADVKSADALLSRVLRQGYSGARIIVE